MIELLRHIFPASLPEDVRPRSWQCVVTSPPYWGLRDYGLAPVDWPRRGVDGGGDHCPHEWDDRFCRRCGAWRGCECESADPVPCIVGDPFGGAGTVGLVAQRLGRRAQLLDANLEYLDIARRRIKHATPPLFADHAEVRVTSEHP